MFLHKCFKFNISACKQRVDRHDGTVHRHKAQEPLPEHGPRHRDRKAESNRTKGLLTQKKRHGENSMNVKGHLLRCKRYPFRLQNMVFQEPKDHLLQRAEYQHITKAHKAVCITAKPPRTLTLDGLPGHCLSVMHSSAVNIYATKTDTGVCNGERKQQSILIWICLKILIFA